MPRNTVSEPPVEPRVFRSPDEIDHAIEKLRRRIDELVGLDVRAAVVNDSGEDDVARSNIQETIREVFGDNSPEFREHCHLDIWAGAARIGMSNDEIVARKEAGKRQTTTILEGLIGRLEEKRLDMTADGIRTPAAYLDDLNLHPRVAAVAVHRFQSGYPWDAVFAAAKALVNLVKERSGRDDLDGTGLMRTVFSRNDPVIAFNDLSDQTDLDEQEGMMHLFEGAVLGIRNPGGHAFPEGSEQRAVEYLSLLSLLAYRVDEATERKPV